MKKSGLVRGAKDTTNQEFFYLCLMHWENQNWQYKPDANAAFEKHKARMKAQQEPSIQEPVMVARPRSIWRFLAIAASITLFVVAGTGYFFKDNIQFFGN